MICSARGWRSHQQATGFAKRRFEFPLDSIGRDVSPSSVPALGWSDHESRDQPKRATMRAKQLTFPTIGGDVVTVRQRGKHYVQPRGYADHPGTGPIGQTCKTCQWIIKFRRWNKCEKSAHRWTGGRGSDILAGAPACRLWQEYKPKFHRATVMTESEMLTLIDGKNRCA